MATKVAGNEALREIGVWAAEQMGVEPNLVGRILVDLNCNDIINAKVTVYWTEPMVEGLKEHVSRFKLVPLAVKVEGDWEGPLRRLVETAEAVTAGGDEPFANKILALRRAAQRMREIVPKADDE